MARNLFVGSFFIRKFLATVKAILADSFITSPKCPVNSKLPSDSFSDGNLFVVVSTYKVDPPKTKNY